MSDDPPRTEQGTLDLSGAVDRIAGAADRQALVDATVAIIADFGFRELMVARMERRGGFQETVAVLATFPELHDYFRLDLMSGDPAVIVGQGLDHPILVPFDPAAWRSLSPGQRAALYGPLAARIGTRLFLPGTATDGATSYGVCFSGGGPEAGAGVGEVALLLSLGRAVARRLAELDGRQPVDAAPAVPIERLLTAAPPRPVGPADSGLIARQQRMVDWVRPPSITILPPSASAAPA